VTCWLQEVHRLRAARLLPQLDDSRVYRGFARSNGMRYHCPVIRSFRDKDAQQLFDRRPLRRLGADVQRIALRKLRQLDAAITLGDLRVPPGNRLERLRGERAGGWSIRINDQWRICFRWAGGDAHDVEIVDYH
jgi:proteic killer suppression protein